MAAINVVRFRVKPGREQEFVDAHRDMRSEIRRYPTRMAGQDG